MGSRSYKSYNLTQNIILRPDDRNHLKETTNLSSANISNVEDILEEEEIDESDSENESDGDDDSNANDNNDRKNEKAEEDFPKSTQTFVGKFSDKKTWQL